MLLHVQRHVEQRVRLAVIGIDLVDLEQAHFCTGLPRYAARTSGFALIASGVPSAILRPLNKTVMRSARPNTTSMSCSTITMVTPAAIRLSKRIVSCRSDALIPAVGSSSNSVLGLVA